jgi:hypothetical protein
MFRPIVFITSCALLVSAGCVIVQPHDVHVAASPVPFFVGSPEPSDPQDRYHTQIHRVQRQQAKVAKELEKQKWKNVVEEAGDWTEYTRTLNEYAELSRDPKHFRQCCGQLLTQIEQLRSAAFRHDAVACEKALRACDPLLDQLSRDQQPGPPAHESQGRRPQAP